MDALNHKFFWKIFFIYNLYCKFRINKLLPGIQKVIDDYNLKTKSTGTKYSTLYRAVKLIKKNKPRCILESGTGTSTIVLAETVLFLKKQNPSYDCKIVSMESMEEWFQIAKKILPQKYNEIVEIKFGKRKIFEYSIFRGYVHTNIPKLSYDFIFLDGPNYEDCNGSSTCMDGVKARLISDSKIITCVIDTRVSSIFMMQNIFGPKSIKYNPILRTTSFDMPSIQEKPKLRSENFKYNIFGTIKIKKIFIKKA